MRDATDMINRAIDLVSTRLEYWNDVRMDDLDQEPEKDENGLYKELPDHVDWTEVRELAKVAAELSRADTMSTLADYLRPLSRKVEYLAERWRL